jgi:hypothetical protein
VTAPTLAGDVALAWTAEARERLDRAPAFVRPGIVKLMAKRARERGRAVVDSEFLTEIRNESMLLVARCLRRFGLEELSSEAFDVARARMHRLPGKLRVIGEIERFLAGRTERNAMVLAKFQRYLEMIPDRGLPWTEEALARIQRVPDGVRPLARQAIETAAREARERLVSGAVVDRCLAGFGGAAPPTAEGPRAGGPVPGVTMLWTAEAEERLRRIPLAPIREIVVRRAEARARSQGLQVVDAAALGEAPRLLP